MDIVEHFLTPELSQHGYDVNKMSDYDVENLAKDIANIMKNDYLIPSTGCLPYGKPTVDMNGFSSNIPSIVQSILGQAHVFNRIN